MKKINPEDGGGLSNKKKGEPGKSLEDKEQQTENSTRGEKKETLSKEVSSFLTRDLQRKFFLFFFLTSIRHRNITRHLGLPR